MRNFTFALLIFISASASAQEKSSTQIVTEPVNNVYPLQPVYADDAVNLSWDVAKEDINATWEIQACKKGQAYKTIGLVWGTAEGESKCSFKTKTKKLSSTFNDYRVIKYSDLAAK